MIAIIDYGVGNLFSLSSSLKFLGLDCLVTSKKEEIEASEKIILPGVGAFGDAMAAQRDRACRNHKGAGGTKTTAWYLPRDAASI